MPDCPECGQHFPTDQGVRVHISHKHNALSHILIQQNKSKKASKSQPTGDSRREISDQRPQSQPPNLHRPADNPQPTSSVQQAQTSCSATPHLQQLLLQMNRPYARSAQNRSLTDEVYFLPCRHIQSNQIVSESIGCCQITRKSTSQSTMRGSSKNSLWQEGGYSAFRRWLETRPS